MRVKWECRYTETKGKYSLAMYSADLADLSGGLLTEAPVWLKQIRTLAALGEHGAAVRYPPPEYILWFQLDADKELCGFNQVPGKHLYTGISGSGKLSQIINNDWSLK